MQKGTRERDFKTVLEKIGRIIGQNLSDILAKLADGEHCAWEALAAFLAKTIPKDHANPISVEAYATFSGVETSQMRINMQACGR